MLGMGHKIRQDWLTHVIATPPDYAAVGGAQLLRGLCASYGGIDWEGWMSHHGHTIR